MITRRRLWFLGAGAAAAALALVGWALIPKPDLYYGVSFSSLVTDRQGQTLKLRLADDGRYRLFVALEDIAAEALDATLLYEDRRFHRHPGVDPAALVRAAWTTYFRRSRTVGGSTITMQLARMRFDLDTRSPAGKLVQSARALQLERHYTKAEILEAYLNLAPYGGSIEGIGTASRVYFGKPASALDLGEALALAVIPQNPVARFPVTVGGRARLMAARARLAAAWRAANPGADEETLARVRLEPVFRSPADLPDRAPHFVRDHVPWIAAWPRSARRSIWTCRPCWRPRAALRRAASPGRDRQRGRHADRPSADGGAGVGWLGGILRRSDRRSGERRPRPPLPRVDAEAAALRVGHRRGLIHPMTLLEDAPRRYAAYAPENFDRGFLGPVFARDALIHSRNLPAVSLLEALDVARFRDWLDEAGVGELKPAEHYGLALALGGSEITMEELVRLYAVLAGGGVWRDLSTTAGASAAPAKRLLSPEASFLVLDMLRDVPRPDALSLVAGTRQPVAWKTGTSFGFRDAWSVGVAGRYVLAVWVGNFDGSANPAFVGREAAAPLFFAIADSLNVPALSDQPATALNLRRVDVCATTGDLPGRHCPRTTRSWFIPGVSPIRESSVYRAVRVDPATGLRSCRTSTTSLRRGA